MRYHSFQLFGSPAGNLGHSGSYLDIVDAPLEYFCARTYGIDGNVPVGVASAGPTDVSHFVDDVFAPNATGDPCFQLKSMG